MHVILDLHVRVPKGPKLNNTKCKTLQPRWVQGSEAAWTQHKNDPLITQVLENVVAAHPDEMDVLSTVVEQFLPEQSTKISAI